jgi:hypothetical protein
VAALARYRRRCLHATVDGARKRNSLFVQKTYSVQHYDHLLRIESQVKFSFPIHVSPRSRHPRATNRSRIQIKTTLYPHLMAKKRKHKAREGRIEKDVDIASASNYASLPRLLPYAGGEEGGTTKVARRDEEQEETPTYGHHDAWSPSSKKRKKSKKRSRKDTKSSPDGGTPIADARKRNKVRGRSGGQGPGQNGTWSSSRSDRKTLLLCLDGGEWAARFEAGGNETFTILDRSKSLVLEETSRKMCEYI